MTEIERIEAEIAGIKGRHIGDCEWSLDDRRSRAEIHDDEVRLLQYAEAGVALAKDCQACVESDELTGVFSFAAAHRVEYTGPEFGTATAAFLSLAPEKEDD